MIRRYRQREDGFTLIELLVVMIIIGILAAVAIPIFMNQQRKANETTLRSDMKNAAQSMHTWYVSNPEGSLVPDPSRNSWGLIFLGQNGTFLNGGPHTASTVLPAAFDAPRLSKGTGIGINARNNLAVGSPSPGQFCILGNMENSSYDVPDGFVSGTDGRSIFSYNLYYDSVAGGLFTPESLPSGGACNFYKTRILSGM